MKTFKELFISGEKEQAIGLLTGDEETFAFFNQSGYSTIYFDILTTQDAEGVKYFLEKPRLSINGTYTSQVLGMSARNMQNHGSAKSVQFFTRDSPVYKN